MERRHQSFFTWEALFYFKAQMCITYANCDDTGTQHEALKR